MLKLIDAGIEVVHHEVGSAGQAEIDLRFSTLTDMADRMMLYKYIVKNVCYQQGYTAAFMPKPVFGDNGSGMHLASESVGRERPASSMTRTATRC